MAKKPFTMHSYFLYSGVQHPNSAPVKAEVVTNEVNDVNPKTVEPKKAALGPIPPPYHIAASMSKHASDFQAIRDDTSSSNADFTDTSSQVQLQDNFNPPSPKEIIKHVSFRGT